MNNPYMDIILKNQQIKLLEKQIDILKDIKDLNEQIIEQKDSKITSLEKKLNEVMTLCDRAISLAKLNTIKTL